jgi:hypothetical protein
VCGSLGARQESEKSVHAMEEPSTEAVLNCTVRLMEADATLDAPLPRFGEFGPMENSTWLLRSLNVSSQVLLEVLSPLLDEDDLSLHPRRKQALRQFLSLCLYPDQPRPFALPWWQKTVWSVVFGAMLLVAVGGNAIVMWIVLGENLIKSSKCANVIGLCKFVTSCVLM